MFRVMPRALLGRAQPPGACAPRPTRVQLRDGAAVSLRDATAGDVSRLRDMFFTLSQTTRYLYFCAGVPATDRWAERVAALGVAEGMASYAMVAEAGGALVGVARFDRAPQGSCAEIGILLADAWQSRGLGREVVARLRSVALCRGLSGFTATVLGENRRAWRLLHRAFPDMRSTWSYGQYTLSMPFTSLPVTSPVAER